MQTTLEKILTSFLLKIDVQVSQLLIEQQLKSHPEYPSLLSITDTLNYLGIKNVAVKIEKNQLHEVPTPFLAHLNIKAGEFVIVEDRNTLNKVYPGFFENWSGVVVVAEKIKEWRNSENEVWLRKEKEIGKKKVLAFIAVTFIIIAAVVFSSSWVMNALLIVAIAGILNSWLIILRDLGIENKIVEQICGPEMNCDFVINSRKTKLFLGISWGDISIIWFTSLFIILILSVFASNYLTLINLISILSAVAILFTIGSLYSQLRIEKKWCRLCLITVGLLWIQFGLLLTPFINNTWQTIDMKDILFVSSIILFGGLVWLALKPLLLQNKQLISEFFDGIRFKRDQNIFTELLKTQRKVDIISWDNDFQLGNSEAPLQITVACNPYCAPCALAHEKLHDIVEEYGDQMGLTIRFTVTLKNKEDKRTQAIQYILQHIEYVSIHMNAIQKAKYTRKILHQWFSLMDYEKFLTMYPAKENIDVDDVLRKNEEWINKSKIAFTPTFFINGHEIPKLYKLNDLRGLISSLIIIDVGLNQRENIETITVYG